MVDYEIRGDKLYRYYRSDDWHVLPVGNRVNFDNPESNWLIKGNSGQHSYVLCWVEDSGKERQIVISGAGSGYGPIGSWHYLIHDQTRAHIGTAIVMAIAFDVKHLKKYANAKSLPLYVFK